MLLDSSELPFALLPVTPAMFFFAPGSRRAAVVARLPLHAADLATAVAMLNSKADVYGRGLLDCTLDTSHAFAVFFDALLDFGTPGPLALNKALANDVCGHDVRGMPEASVDRQRSQSMWKN